MSAEEIKGEWNLILVKKKKKKDRSWFSFLKVDLNTIMCNFETDYSFSLKFGSFFSFLKFFHELPYKCNPEETKVESDPP